MTDRTETNAIEHAHDDTRLVPYLFVVLEGGRPLAGGARLRCDGLDAISIGRGEPAGTSIEGRTAKLALPDRRMSTAHARIERAAHGWQLVDTGSKNGCRVDGVETPGTTLRDGAWIEVGQTVLRFRATLPEAAPVWLAAEHATPVLGQVTLVPQLAALLGELARLATSTVPLVLTGETGTGKELLARAVHQASGRGGPFVAVNCAALSTGLVESQLFGHTKGAFSGAITDHDGFVRAADGGTLLLDEVGDLAPPAQAALLRVVQEREVVPVGGTRGVPVDVRFIAATLHDPRARLREDLYARLAGYVAKLPALSARREDLGTIAATALRRHAGDRAGRIRFTGQAALQLATSPWPHNARELDKAIEAALALVEGDELDVAQLPQPASRELPGDAAARARLEALLAAHRGNISQVAREMGKARMQIQRWLKRFGLDPEAFKR